MIKSVGKRFFQTLSGILIATFVLWLLFKDTNWKVVSDLVVGADVKWLLLAQFFAWSGYYMRLKRWSYVVRASHQASYWSLFSATQIAFLVNFLVPARVGELVRAFILSRKENLAFAQCTAFVALDRVNELFGLLAVLLLAITVFPKNQSQTIAAGAFGNANTIEISSGLIWSFTFIVMGVLGAVIALLAGIYFGLPQMLALIDRFFGSWWSKGSARIKTLLKNFAEGMHVFRSRIDLIKSVAWSLLIWAAGILALESVINAFGGGFPWYTPIVMMALVSVFIAVPVTPGVVGQYHLPVILALSLTRSQFENDLSKTIAIVAHASMLIPIGALGIFALSKEQFRLADLLRLDRPTV